MGCGGYGDIFSDIFYYGRSRRGCGGDDGNIYNLNSRNDIDEKMIVIKKMYAEGIIDDYEYQMYKQRSYSGTIDFEELMQIRSNKNNRGQEQRTDSAGYKSESKQYQQSNKYKDQITSLNESKGKLVLMSDRLTEKIDELGKKKEQLESIAETLLRSSEGKAEEYIRKRLDVEENIQSLEKNKRDLQKQIEELDDMIKSLETRELEFEALNLKEEISKIKESMNK